MTDRPSLPKHYPARDVERRWQSHWQDTDLYAFDPDHPGKVYAVDTPPPTVSGQIHIGHVFSYTQAEILIRFRRMQGKNVFYPFGFDDNGLPTERFVEETRGVSARDMTRGEFVKLCAETVVDAEEQYESLWRSLGLSADWSQCYRTIDERSRRISQRSFIDLYEKDKLARQHSPSLWCPSCQTALAQADLEDQEMPGAWHHVVFKADADATPITIATTRPELLPACVALIHHPTDERYAGLTGASARVPFAGHLVPIIADERADPEKGTGIVMCCTFGDQTDIEWWRQYKLPYRQTFTLDGRLTKSGVLDGLSIPEARTRVAELLQTAGELTRQECMQHPVRVHERCATPVEFAISKQWFVKVLEHKDELIARADAIRWYPDFMKARYVHWVENLSWDWCISRQRYYGVPIPVWFCKACDAVITPDDDALPVDPIAQAPPAPCSACGSQEFEPERDVLDTWATSSVTPQINARWGESDDRSQTLAPMAMRPQAHDIIRTWAFYTIVKAHFHSGQIPWQDAVISGHVKQRSSGPSRRSQGKDAKRSKLEKISKSRAKSGAVSTPADLIEEWSADAVRYWTAGASLGSDMAYDLQEMSQGQRFLTKLYNATKFAMRFLDGYDGTPAAALWPVDAWALGTFGLLCERTAALFDEYNFFHARLEAEGWFWGSFCDNYLELVKGRLYAGQDLASGKSQAAADPKHIQRGFASGQATLYQLLLGQYKLFAPIVPHITEELYHHLALPNHRQRSIHIERFPARADYPDDLRARGLGDEAVQVLKLVRRFKSTEKIAMGGAVGEVRVAGLSFDPAEERQLTQDLAHACRAQALVGADTLARGDVLEEGSIQVQVSRVEATA